MRSTRVHMFGTSRSNSSREKPELAMKRGLEERGQREYCREGEKEEKVRWRDL